MVDESGNRLQRRRLATIHTSSPRAAFKENGCWPDSAAWIEVSLVELWIAAGGDHGPGGILNVATPVADSSRRPAGVAQRASIRRGRTLVAIAGSEGRQVLGHHDARPPRRRSALKSKLMPIVNFTPVSQGLVSDVGELNELEVSVSETSRDFGRSGIVWMVVQVIARSPGPAVWLRKNCAPSGRPGVPFLARVLIAPRRVAAAAWGLLTRRLRSKLKSLLLPAFW